MRPSISTASRRRRALLGGVNHHVDDLCPLGWFPSLLVNCGDQFDFLENIEKVDESTLAYVFDIDILS